MIYVLIAIIIFLLVAFKDCLEDLKATQNREEQLIEMNIKLDNKIYELERKLKSLK